MTSCTALLIYSSLAIFAGCAERQRRATDWALDDDDAHRTCARQALMQSLDSHGGNTLPVSSITTVNK